HPVVMHDFTVERTTNGWGRVQDLTLEELKRLDAGSWFDEEFEGERIPTLEEVLDLVGPAGVTINIEIKNGYAIPWRNGEEALTRKVAEAVQARGLADRVFVSCYNPLVLWLTRRLMPQAKIALSVQRDLPVFLARGWFIPLLNPDALHPEHAIVNARYVEWAHEKGYRLHAWTPNEPSKMRRLIKLGLDGIITDRPDFLRQVMAQTLGS
ncbi:MAG: glycerophosphodiester phosphodiesterase, partial [Chloroflexi bacterium]|nr:glycerophosphodiester phosphodiesterase [Chloroflexota bacterium]